MPWSLVAHILYYTKFTLPLSLSISLSVSLGIVKLPEKHFVVETGLLAYEVILFTQYKLFFPNCAK